MLAIPSPDLLVNLFASGAQVMGLLAVALGGSWITKQKKGGLGAAPARSRWPFRITVLLLIGVSAAFTMYVLQVKDEANRRLQANLTRSSKEAGKKVGDISLKTLGFSDQAKHPRALSSETIAARIASGQPVNLIDIREPEEIELGRIAGTWTRRYPDLRVHREGLSKPNMDTILLCDSGNRSSELVNEFTKEGIPCFFMIGGYEKWVAEHRPLVDEGPRSGLRDIPAFPNKGVLLDTAAVEKLVSEENALFVDVRYPEDFAKGALPGAENLTLRKMLQEEIEPALRALPRRPIVVPCYDKRSSFYGLILGLRLHRLGLDFRGRYTVPHEYFVPSPDPAHIAAWQAEQQSRTLFSDAAGVVATWIEALGRSLSNILLALVLVVFLARVLLLPATLKADRDQLVLRGLAPQIAALRVRHAGDPAAARSAIFALQRAEHLTPVRNLLGSLTMLLVFIVLFGAVNIVAAEQATPFLWLSSLGAADPLRVLPLAVGALFVTMLAVVSEKKTLGRAALWCGLGAVITFAVWTLPAISSLYLLVSLGLMLGQRALFAAWWQRRETRRLGTPPARLPQVTAEQPILPLAKVEHVELAGRKARRLSALMRAGFPVPDGFVVCSAQGLGNDRGTAAIVRGFDKLGAKTVAVRSSGVAEDGESSSHAGEYDSKLEVTKEHLLAAVAQVEHSLAAPHSQDSERKDHGGVIVQEMVPAEHAGVLFTEDPSCSGAMLVEMTKGLGDNLVSGLVDPDPFRFGRLSHKALHAQAAPIDLTPLLELGRRAEALFGRPQDIEWAHCNGKFFILQSRDITCRAQDVAVADLGNAVAQREAARASVLALAGTDAQVAQQPAQALLVQNELSELLPEPTPLSLALMNELWGNDGAVDRAARRLGIPYQVAADSAPYAVCVFGRLYVHKVEEKRRFARGIGALASLRLTRSAKAIEQEYREHFLPKFQREVRLREAVDPTLLGFPELVDAFAAARERFVGETYVEAEVVNLASTFFTNVARQRLLRAGHSPAELLGAIHPTILPKLVAKLRLCGEQGLMASLAEFGHRAPHDFEIAEPRYGEDLKETRRLVAAAQAGCEAAREPVTTTTKELGRVDSLAVATARTFEALKEEAKHEVLREFACLRRLVLEIGQRLGLGEGVFWLLPQEILGSHAGRAHELAAVVAARRAERAAVAAIELPAELSFAALETLGSRFAFHAPVVQNQGEHLQGLRVAGSGDIVGRARVLKDPRETTTFADGDVLVARFTDPRWLPLFRRARGIVTEVGGWLSHAAIQAREHRLPAIVGVRGVMTTVRDGDLVCLRADGSVEIVQDRRQRARASTVQPVTIRVLGRELSGQVSDSNETGLGVTVYGGTFEIGESVEVNLGDQRISATVAHHREGHLGLTLGAPFSRAFHRKAAVG